MQSLKLFDPETKLPKFVVSAQSKRALIKADDRLVIDTPKIILECSTPFESSDDLARDISRAINEYQSSHQLLISDKHLYTEESAAEANSVVVTHDQHLEKLQRWSETYLSRMLVLKDLVKTQKQQILELMDHSKNTLRVDTDSLIANIQETSREFDKTTQLLWLETADHVDEIEKSYKVATDAIAESMRQWNIVAADLIQYVNGTYQTFDASMQHKISKVETKFKIAENEINATLENDLKDHLQQRDELVKTSMGKVNDFKQHAHQSSEEITNLAAAFAKEWQEMWTDSHADVENIESWALDQYTASKDFVGVVKTTAQKEADWVVAANQSDFATSRNDLELEAFSKTKVSETNWQELMKACGQIQEHAQELCSELQSRLHHMVHNEDSSKIDSLHEVSVMFKQADQQILRDISDLKVLVAHLHERIDSFTCA